MFNDKIIFIARNAGSLGNVIFKRFIESSIIAIGFECLMADIWRAVIRLTQKANQTDHLAKSVNIAFSGDCFV